MSIPAQRAHRSVPQWFGERIVVVLVEPSHPGNVGACARAMRVMGLHRLRLVAPRLPDVASHPEAWARSSGAVSVLNDAQVFDDLDAALADVPMTYAISAESREFAAPLVQPETLALEVVDALASDRTPRVALVFGPERTGLSIEAVGRCQRVCAIPGDPEYNSLNLAQAVQIIAYVLRRAAEGRVAAGDVEDAVIADANRTELADHRDVEALHAHLERALVALGYLDPAHPKKLMARFRRLFGRARLEVDEVQMLRGVCRLIEEPSPKRR